MVYFFWPCKSVPNWLERISFHGRSDGTPSFKHYGFGFVINRGGWLHAYVLIGAFLLIDAAGMSVHVKGGGHGVIIRQLNWRKE